jgi:hypothetical protein
VGLPRGVRGDALACRGHPYMFFGANLYYQKYFLLSIKWSRLVQKHSKTGPKFFLLSWTVLYKRKNFFNLFEYKMVQNNEPLRNQTDLSNLRIVWIRMPGPR